MRVKVHLLDEEVIAMSDITPDDGPSFAQS
jgi:hypothetical protein